MLTLPQVALVVSLLTGVTAYPGLREELEEATAVWTEAFNQHDAEKTALTYTEDCSLLPPGYDVAHGREGVKEVLKSMFERGMAKIAIVTGEVGPMDATDGAYDRSSFTVYDEEDNIVTKGKHVVIWKKVDGVWLIHVDILNTNMALNPQMDDDTLKAELAVLREMYRAAWKAQDVSALSSLYAEDARFMPHEHHTIQGRNAIQKAIEMQKDKGMTGLDIKPEESGYLGLSKDMAYERGYYSFLQSDGEPAEKGKYVFLSKRVDGQWKIYVDMLSPNAPPQKPHDEL